MKKILLSVFGLLLLGLTNFSSAYILSGYDNFKFKNNISNEEVGFINGYTYCIDYDGSLTSWLSICNSNYSINSNNLLCFVSSCTSVYSLSGGPYNVYKFEDGFPIYSSNSGASCDYTEYENTINSCLNDLGNYSTSLNMCYYDLGNCRAGICSGDYLSTLYINNIQYPGNNSLYVNIPEGFDYSYNMSGDYSDIDIEYKLDTGYIAGIITNQITYPTKEDFNNILDKLIPLFVPGLVVILFLYFVFRFLKKIF